MSIRIDRALRGILCAATLVWCSLSNAEGSYPGPSWSAATSTQATWSESALKASDKIASTTQTDAYLIVHRGALVHSFGDIAKPRDIYSVRKSVLSILMGMSVDRGLVDLDQSMASLQIDDVAGLSEQEKSATVRQLLQARSGVYHGAAYETPGMKAARPPRGSQAPGALWYYNNWDFNVLGSIFQQKSGKSVFEALRDDLAEPLRFQDFNMSRDTKFVTEAVSRHPAYTMKMSARDLARIGLLMARDGQWDGQQLVSSRWVAQSTALHSTAPSRWQGYGYLWWTPVRAWPFWKRGSGDVFFAWGSFGQFLFVDRGRDLVIVHQADRRRFFGSPVTDETISPLLESILAAVPRQ